MKNIIMGLGILLVSTSLYALGDPLDFNDIHCYSSISKSECSSEGYITGKNYTQCRVSIIYKNFEGKYNRHVIYGDGYEKTDTGLLAGLTLGISDVIANQVNYLRASSRARSEIRNAVAEIKDVLYRCE